jgi:hypothetical protein
VSSELDCMVALLQPILQVHPEPILRCLIGAWRYIEVVRNRNRPLEEPGCYALLMGILPVDPGIKTAGGGL